MLLFIVGRVDDEEAEDMTVFKACFGRYDAWFSFMPEKVEVEVIVEEDDDDNIGWREVCDFKWRFLITGVVPAFESFKWGCSRFPDEDKKSSCLLQPQVDFSLESRLTPWRWGWLEEAVVVL